MPQTITIVLCYKCKKFQTKIVTISKKWTCKVCGEKQSLKNTYGTGSGKDCREQVQKLNENHEEIIEQKETEMMQLFENEDGDLDQQEQLNDYADGQRKF